LLLARRASTSLILPRKHSPFSVIAFPNTFGEFIQALFINVGFLEIKMDGMNIFAYLPDKQIPIALGKEGFYIHLVNKMIKEMVGNYTIYLRSRDF
jgi:hypothetical protein